MHKKTPPCSELFEELSSYINDDAKREHECRKFLEHIPEFLFTETVNEFVNIEEEYRGNSGDSDYVISAKIEDESGLDCVRAYVWELKAPQCYLFEKDTENRLKPTKQLIKAENQLFHYYHEQKGSNQFRQDFNVTHPDNVFFGGIIIGCNNNLVKNFNDSKNKKKKLYEKAMNIRKTYIYDRLNIRLITWNAILDQFRPANYKRGKDKTIKVDSHIDTELSSNVSVSSSSE